MGKISISVRIPALANDFDFIVPSDMSVKDAQSLIIRILCSEYGIMDVNTDAILFDRNDGKALRTDNSFAQLGISDGDKLIMI